MRSITFKMSAVLFISLWMSASLLAQSAQNVRAPRVETARPVDSAAQESPVPKFIKFSGSVPAAVDSSTNSSVNEAAAPKHSGVNLTFEIYTVETGGTPIYVENQNIAPDAQGKFSVLLGSGSTNGLPTDIFSDNTARWLAVKLPDGTEQSRVMLVAVPYSMKSVDTEKLGGKDAGTYVQSSDLPSKVSDVLTTHFGFSKEDLKAQRIAVKARNATPQPGINPILTISGDNGNVFRINSNGEVYSSGGYFVGAADFAESVETVSSPEGYEQGDVMVIDTVKVRRVDMSDQPYSTLVAGIVSTKPGLLGSQYNDPNDPKLDKEIPLAVVGIVPCKVSAENGEIKIGDLLVTSSSPGYAMKGTDRSRMLGAVLGKALEPLKVGKGVILVMVTLQ